MSCNKSNCIIALGLTIMDRCAECEKIDRVEKETQELTNREIAAREQEALRREREACMVPSVSRDGGKTWRRVDEPEDVVRESGSLENATNGALFFVTCIEDEGQRRVGYLLGPYTTHAEAIANVDRGAKLACGASPKANWYSFGTCSIQEPTERKGMFGK
jgi:hypothetical protein